MHKESEAIGAGLETKYCRPSGAGLSLQDGNVVEGYASVFGQVDRGGDIVAPGAFAASLAQMAKDGCRPKMLWQHDPGTPIGVWDEIREDKRGLHVRGRLLREVARGREAAALIAAGALDGLSIGYRTRRADRDAQGRRRLLDLELWEVSLVTFPMLPEARVGAKGEEPRDRLMQDLAAALEAAREEMGVR